MPVGSTVVDGKYRVERTIGRGGMGVVVEATHLGLRERVAIKLLLPELVDSEEAAARFRREGRALFKMRSRHVCRVLDVGTTEGGSPFLVMELLEGEDIASHLGRGERFGVEEAVLLTIQACQGLADAHARGIVHRDLKPENLFITTDVDGEPCLKLLDFGLSKVTGDGLDSHRSRKLTADAQVMGTPHYMAPEQWMSSKDVGPAADQWSIATILFEMIAGRPPFPGVQVANICSAVLNAPTPSLGALRDDIPKGLDAVLRKALEKNPADRYQNVGAFAVALSPFVPPGAAMEAERALAMLNRVPVEAEVSFPLSSPRDQASDMQATVPQQRSPLDEGAGRGRQVTSSSWQKLVEADRSRSRLAVAVGLATVALLAIISIVMLGGDPPTPPSSSAIDASSPAAPAASGAAPTTASADVQAATPTAEPTATVASRADGPDGGAEAQPSVQPSVRPRPPVPRPSHKPKPDEPDLGLYEFRH